jgi:protocatechuate 3,4-dioxygenase alpha subunit
VSTHPLTTSQTIGPFFSPSLLRDDARRNVLVQPGTEGERIRIEGRVLDGDGLSVTDALVEIWQANARGRYNHPADTGPAALDPAFAGFGRSGTDEDGGYWFETVKPGPVPLGRGGFQAPHIVVTVFARGLLNHAVTRLYFGDDPATRDDPVLLSVPAERRPTLLAARHQSDGQPVYRFNIILQGEAETVFFNV